MDPSGERSAHRLSSRQLNLLFMVPVLVLAVLVLTGVLSHWFVYLGGFAVPPFRWLLRRRIGR